MRRLLAVFIFLLLVLPTGAAEKVVEGKWACKSEDVKQTKLDWTLVITRTDGVLKAEMFGGMGSDVLTLRNVKFENKTFTGDLFINPPDDITTLTLKLDGDRLDGTFDGKGSGAGTFLCGRQ